MGQWNGILCVFPTVAGRTYTVHYTLGLNGGPKLTPFVRNNITSANIQVQHITSDGRYTLTFVAPSSETMFAVENPNTGTRSMYLSYLFVQDVNAAAVVEDFYYVADVKSYSDYMPFGMQMPNRNGSTEEYRYGFNGMEADDEVKGLGNSYTTEWRQYDPRVSRWLSNDPLAHEFPWNSPYVSMSNNPILRVDPNGDVDGIYIDEETGEKLGEDEFGESDGKIHFTSKENWDKFGNSPYDKKSEMLKSGVSETINVFEEIAKDKFLDDVFTGVGVGSLILTTSEISLTINSKQVFKYGTDGKSAEEVTELFSKQMKGAAKFVGKLALIGEIAGTGYTWYQIITSEDDVKPIEYFDATVGTVGATTSILAVIGVVSNPVGWIVGGATGIYLIYRSFQDD